MWHIRAVFIAMAGISLILVPGVRGDSLQLKNGNFVQGKYLGGTERAVQFEVNGKIRLYDTGEILSINFAAASADGGIPSDSADPKPGANTESNSAFRHNAEMHTALRIEKKPHGSLPSGSTGLIGARIPSEKGDVRQLLLIACALKSRDLRVFSD
jgi:hypothetical protein